MRIYLAAPLFNAAEQRFNARLTWQLEERGHSVFLPQRDGYELAEIDASGAAEHRVEMRLRVFALDTSEVIGADLVLAVLDGRVPDEGVCVEIGIAWATRRADPSRGDRWIVGLKTDSRAWLPGDDLNPMVSQALDEVFADEQALLDWLARLSPAAPG